MTLVAGMINQEMVKKMLIMKHSDFTGGCKLTNKVMEKKTTEELRMTKYKDFHSGSGSL